MNIGGVINSTVERMCHGFSWSGTLTMLVVKSPMLHQRRDPSGLRIWWNLVIISEVLLQNSEHRDIVLLWGDVWNGHHLMSEFSRLFSYARNNKIRWHNTSITVMCARRPLSTNPTIKPRWYGRDEGPSPLPYHLAFMVELTEEGPLAWNQSWGLGFNSPGHAFSSVARNNFHLPYCLLSTHMTRAHDHDSHAGGGMLDYSIRGSLTPSISPESYGWTDRWGSRGLAIII
jgi:hypothetical protein